MCVGAHLARTEGRIALEVLAERLPEIALAPDFSASYVPSYLFRCLEHLRVEW